MQYPDDFLKNNSVQGRGDKRELDKTDSPYLVRFGPDGVTRKKDRFTVFTPSQAVESPSEPYLYGVYLERIEGSLSAYTLYYKAMIANPESSFGRKPAAVLLQTYEGEYVVRSTRCPFVGDGYVLRIISTDNRSLSATRLWPVLTQAKLHGSEAVEDARKGQSVSFINQVQFMVSTNISMVATGWDGDGFRFAICAFPLIGDDISPRLLIGSTTTQTVTEIALPTSRPSGTEFNRGDGAYISGFHIFPLWRGVLQYVRTCYSTVDMSPLPTPPSIPIICTSTDHGSTWITESIPELASYIAANDSPPFFSFDSAKTIIVYLGGNKSMLIASFKHDRSSNSMPSLPMTIAFLGEDGGNYTRISWPADDWYTPSFRHPVENAVLLSRDWVRSAQFGFGEGCMYLPVIKDNVFKIMFTHDYGSTWEFSVEIPEQLRGIGQYEEQGQGGYINAVPDGFAGIIVKPYVDVNRKGKILFAYPDYDTKRIVFLRTDGTFSKFTRVGSVNTASNQLTPQRQPSLNEDFFYTFDADGRNYTFTNYSRYVYPAFPREFDKP